MYINRKFSCVLVVLILVVIETGWLPGAKSGFYCDDRTIAHHFDGDTISLNLLLGVSFVAPLIAVSILSLLYLFFKGCKSLLL